jgi:hypothetical protein
VDCDCDCVPFERGRGVRVWQGRGWMFGAGAVCGALQAQGGLRRGGGKFVFCCVAGSRGRLGRDDLRALGVHEARMLKEGKRCNRFRQSN